MEFIRIYQNPDGSFLPDSSQPHGENDFAILSKEYTPHASTRYINVHMGDNGKPQRRDSDGDLINVDGKLPELYKKRENCCGCSACCTICSVKAIDMRPDEEGFLYPVVDAEKCIRCYNCMNVCIFK